MTTIGEASARPGIDIDIRDFNVYPGTGNDQTTGIAAAIAQIPTTGGVVLFQSGVYDITSGFSLINKHGAGLVGVAADHSPYGPPGTPIAYGTILKWGGGASPMLLVGSDATQTRSVRGQRLENIAFDGQGVADKGVLGTSLNGGTIRNVYIRECATVCFDMTTVSMAASEDNQLNVIDQLTLIQNTTTAGIGMRLSSAAPGVGNTSFNEFPMVFIFHNNGVGLQLIDADSNHFGAMFINRVGGGTGYSIELRGSAGPGGHARDNLFDYVSATGGIIARGTSSYTVPSGPNFITNYNLGNAAPLPVIETGAGLLYNTSAGNDYANSYNAAVVVTAPRATVNDVRFPAVQVPSADANDLDDYEEGAPFNAGISFAAAGDLSVAYSAQSCIYTKIGRLVFVQGRVTTSSFTHTTASGNLLLTGLPFTVGTLAAVGSCAIRGWTWGANEWTVIRGIAGTTTADFPVSNTASAIASLATSVVPTGGTVDIIFSLTYVV